MSATIINPGPVQFSIYQPMVSASGEAESRVYRLITPEKGPRWVVAVQGNPADNIYKDGGPGSEGMAGRTLTFPLEDGTSVDFKGPWKCMAGSLFEATGVDVRDLCETHGIIALRRENGPDAARMRLTYNEFYDVLHLDEGWQLGTYDRIDELAYKFAKELGVKVWFSVISHGGGRASWHDAETISRRENPHPRREQ